MLGPLYGMKDTPLAGEYMGIMDQSATLKKGKVPHFAKGSATGLRGVRYAGFPAYAWKNEKGAQVRTKDNQGMYTSLSCFRTTLAERTRVRNAAINRLERYNNLLRQNRVQEANELISEATNATANDGQMAQLLASLKSKDPQKTPVPNTRRWNSQQMPDREEVQWIVDTTAGIPQQWASLHALGRELQLWEAQQQLTAGALMDGRPQAFQMLDSMAADLGTPSTQVTPTQAGGTSSGRGTTNPTNNSGSSSLRRSHQEMSDTIMSGGIADTGRKRTRFADMADTGVLEQVTIPASSRRNGSLNNQRGTTASGSPRNRGSALGGGAGRRPSNLRVSSAPQSSRNISMGSPSYSPGGPNYCTPRVGASPHNGDLLRRSGQADRDIQNTFEIRRMVEQNVSVSDVCNEVRRAVHRRYGTTFDASMSRLRELLSIHLRRDFSQSGR